MREKTKVGNARVDKVVCEGFSAGYVYADIRGNARLIMRLLGFVSCMVI